MSLAAKVISLERVSDGIVIATTRDFGAVFSEQLWARSRGRKHSECILTGRAIQPGDEVYRPHTNLSNRGRRMLAVEVDRLPLPDVTPVPPSPPERP